MRKFAIVFIMAAIILSSFPHGLARLQAAGALKATPDLVEITVQPGAKGTQTVTVSGVAPGSTFRITADKSYLSGLASNFIFENVNKTLFPHLPRCPKKAGRGSRSRSTYPKDRSLL